MQSRYRRTLSIATLWVLLLIAGCPTSPTILYAYQDGVWKMHDDGSGKVKVVSNGSHPQWIPGTKDTIAFVRGDAIFNVDYQGTTTPKQIVDQADKHYSWSPDRQWIAYASEKDGNWNVYRVKVDGTGIQQLTNSPALDRYPSWSPKGDKIAFVSNRQNGDFDIYVMDADGSAQTNLTAGFQGGKGADLAPTWSLGGGLIAYWGDRNSQKDIYFIDVATGKITAVTNDAEEQIAPIWAFETSPDGRYLFYFQKTKPPTAQSLSLYRYELATKKIEQLATFASPSVLQPEWKSTVNPAYIYYSVANPLGKTEIFASQYHLVGSSQPGPKSLGEGQQPDY
jgi:TolB protein